MTKLSSNSLELVAEGHFSNLFVYAVSLKKEEVLQAVDETL